MEWSPTTKILWMVKQILHLSNNRFLYLLKFIFYVVMHAPHGGIVGNRRNALHVYFCSSTHLSVCEGVNLLVPKASITHTRDTPSKIIHTPRTEFLFKQKSIIFHNHPT